MQRIKKYKLKGKVMDVRGKDIYFYVDGVGMYIFLISTVAQAKLLMDKEVEVTLIESID